MPLTFTPSQPLTLGVELELQIVDRRTLNLTRGASDLLAALGKREHRGEIKPELTESMIEIATDVASGALDLARDLAEVHSVLLPAARALNLGLSGGGAHPFQKWRERRITDAPRYRRVSELYGYLAKQFTVFGQHVHVGCPNGDAAVRLTQALGRYVPHLIALSASSPFLQGADTAFDSARLNAVNAFPLSGTMPPLPGWKEFEVYFDTMRSYGIVESMKDFYWDIRPKPEYGTVEVRVCDTPLTPSWAVALAGYVQALAAWLLDEERPFDALGLARVYAYNRFQACRFGLHATVIDPESRSAFDLQADLLATLERVAPYAEKLGASAQLARLAEAARGRRNDAARIRDEFERSGTFADVLRWQCGLWSEDASALGG
jgi:carboxylate-amine ligase